MTASRFLGLLAVVVVSGATGSLLNEHWRATGENAPRPVAESGASSLAAPGAMPGPAQAERPVTLYGDGTVTVNVQNRPLKWLLEEIARQIPLRDPAHASVQNAMAKSAPVGNDGTGSETGTLEQRRALQTLQTLLAIREGDEKARYEGLLTAGSFGLPIAPETLKALYETDSSERIRLLAFQQYLDVTQSASLEETRTTLQLALRSTSPAVQTEAQRLLDEIAPPAADGREPQPGNN